VFADQAKNPRGKDPNELHVKKSVSKKRTVVKPVKRYVSKKDSLGRTYTVDKKTGKRVRNELAKREKKRLAKPRRKSADKELAELRAKVRELEEREALTQKRPSQQFVPLEQIPGFLQTTVVRAERYPKVGMALDRAVGQASVEFLGIKERIEGEDYEPTDTEILRGRLLASHLGEDIVYANLDEAASGLAEGYGLDVREVYSLFFSPEVA
jgi:hypothetical protein